ncbi:MAG: DNA topoisomerase I [candidate division WOR-3 bacterium]
MIIAEKPSVAGKIASAIGRAQKKTRSGVPYYEVDTPEERVIIVPAVGHVYSLQEKGNKKWNLNYPVFDVEWDPIYEVQKGSEYTKAYINNIKELCKGADSFINACDYDVEGSVIGTNVLVHACGIDPKKADVKRMHFSTVTAPDLAKAYENLEPFDAGQTEAGLTRHVLDWYYGINLSRALTSAMRAANSRGTLSIGRVQGPALKLIVDKEREIKAFVPTPFWVISALMNKDKDFEAVHTKEKFENEDEAKKVYEKVKDRKTGRVAKVERKEYRQPPPNPFDLTSLQIEAHARHHIPPKQTLEIGQTLYENGYISYPRTSSQQLPPTIGYRQILEKIAKQPEYKQSAELLLRKSSLKPNNGKKTDPAHPAIYPTGEISKGLGDKELKVYDLIVRRFLATFGDWAIRESMNVVIDVNTEPFKAEGKRTVQKNWHELYGKYAKFDEVLLPNLKEGDEVAVKKMNFDKKMTQPPKRYTEASIISELEKRNLGTKATRAVIIDTLFRRNYISGKPIEATELGIKTVETLERHSPEILDEAFTRGIEEGMDDVMAGKKSGAEIEESAKEILTKVLTKFKQEEMEIGRELSASQQKAEAQQAVKDAMGACPVCKEGLLIVRLNPKTKKRFLGCSSYPKCTNTQPLPQSGLAKPAKKDCPTCGYPMANIWTKGKKTPWTICTNFGCPSKQKPEQKA